MNDPAESLAMAIRARKARAGTNRARLPPPARARRLQTEPLQQGLLMSWDGASLAQAAEQTGGAVRHDNLRGRLR